jgi:hypothetical protein
MEGLTELSLPFLAQYISHWIPLEVFSDFFDMPGEGTGILAEIEVSIIPSRLNLLGIQTVGGQISQSRIQ